MDNSIFASQQTMDMSALDSVFNVAPSPDKIVPSGGSNIFLNPSLEKVLDKVMEAPKEEEPVAPVVTDKGVLDILDNTTKELAVAPEETTVEETAEQKAGRPKTDKNALIEYLTSKIEAQDYGVPEDYDTKVPVKDYLGKLPEKELFNILDTNWKVKESEIRSTAPQEFYEALPEPLKIVAEYAAQGGNDWDGLFNSLIQTRHIQQLDVNNESHHAPIVKTYLQTTTQMTENQIDEQIAEWTEAGKLDKKATEFKAPLDTIQQQQNAIYVEQERKNREQEAELANFYATNVHNSLKDNEVAGIKLDKKFARELEYNLTTVAPGPWSGRPVNYLGYGIEKCQYIEPNYQAIAIASWILNDFDNAMAALGQKGANSATEQAVKLIKLNQGIAAGTSVPVQEAKPVKRLPNNSNVLRRTT